MAQSPVSEPGDAPPDWTAVLLAEHTTTVLTNIVGIAVSAVPGAGAASVSVSVAAGVAPGFRTVAATDDGARAADDAQYASGSGPGLDSILSRDEVAADVPDRRWERFSEAAATAGFRSVVALPLRLVAASGGASLNLYSRTSLPWTPEARKTARLIAEHAEIVLAGDLELARSEHMNATLQRALESRTVIGQAQGVLMARQKIGAEEAFDILRRASQRTNRKLRDIATEIVTGVHSPHPPV